MITKMQIYVPENATEKFHKIDIKRGSGSYHVINKSKCIADVTFEGSGPYPHVIFEGPAWCRLFGDDSPNSDYDNIPGWDISGLVSIEGMFENCKFFDQSLVNWVVSNITKMDWAFQGCLQLKQDFSGWPLKEMPLHMFKRCPRMTTDLMPTIEVSPGMFQYSYEFYEYRGDADTLVIPRGNSSAVYRIIKPVDITFDGTGPFPIMHIIDNGTATCKLGGEDSPNSDYNSIPKWNVSGMQRFICMFDGCTYFNQPLNSWKVDNATHMKHMFDGCDDFNQDISSWNVSNVITMYAMFYGCFSFNQPLNSWDVSNVAIMTQMFLGCAYNQPLDRWVTDRVVSMADMFAVSDFNQNIDSWCVANVRDLSGMFLMCKTFNQTLPNWNLRRDANTDRMFDGSAVPEDVVEAIKRSRF